MATPDIVSTVAASNPTHDTEGSHDMMTDRCSVLRSAALPLLATAEPLREARSQSGEAWYPLKGEQAA